jgi:hypothetical protein
MNTYIYIYIYIYIYVYLHICIYARYFSGLFGDRGFTVSVVFKQKDYEYIQIYIYIYIHIYIYGWMYAYIHINVNIYIDIFIDNYFSRLFNNRNFGGFSCLRSKKILNIYINTKKDSNSFNMNLNRYEKKLILFFKKDYKHIHKNMPLTHIYIHSCAHICKYMYIYYPLSISKGFNMNLNRYEKKLMNAFSRIMHIHIHVHRYVHIRLYV